MIYNGLLLGSSVMGYKIPNLGLPEFVRYVPLVVSGLLVISFSIEHVIALVKGGATRTGERVHVSMRDGRTVTATIASPVFFDPKAERQNA